MKLSQHTDYALRLLIYLAIHPDKHAVIHDVAQAYGISSHHLAKVAQEMVQAEWVKSTRGRGGGLQLAKNPKDIHLGSVIRHTETSFQMAECFADDAACPIESACRLKGVLAEARDAFLSVIDRYTLADMVNRPHILVPILLRGESAA